MPLLRLTIPVTLIALAGLIASAGLLALAADPAPNVSATPEEAAKDPDFAIQGEYQGERSGVQVIALGKGKFRTIAFKNGLPGAGWNEKDKQEVDEDAAGVKELVDAVMAKKVERKSKTLGAKPPEGAVVLFDGTKESLDKNWKPGAKISADGLLQQGCMTVPTFNDFSMHIEFRLPYMPLASGQGRGNSGLYFQGRYEVQMLDSFGLAGKDNECGGLYTIKSPDVNMCFPPLAWQTYDVDYTAARWKEGKKIANARVTIKHNGVVVQNDVELPKTTTAAPNAESPEPGPLYLQDHGNPVRYRNIWIVPKSAEQEARRPIVPGYERFHVSSGEDAATAGRLLLGELNCTSCHKASPALAAHVLTKQAPVLTEVGKRIHPEYLLQYLADPHGVKPGTTMPDVLGKLPEAERKSAVLALTNFLSATGTLAQQSADLQSIQHGEQLFHSVGCVACHEPRLVKDKKVLVKGSVPLIGLEKKYSIPSLTAFLSDPHKVRPSGRMPRFGFENNKDYADLACYLIGDVSVKPRNPNMTFAAYYGSWNKAPDFEKLKADKTGQSAGLDLNVAGRTNEFGVSFKGFLKIEKEGDYTFHLGSDDGSLLFIDGQKVVDSDGVHPHTVNAGHIKLKPGLHPLRVDYFQGGGEWTVTLEYEGAGLPRQDAMRSVVMTEKGNPIPEPAPTAAEAPFKFDPALAEQGKMLFTSLGCVNCHALNQNGQPLKATEAKPLAELNLTQGCLAAAAPASAKTPQYDLNLDQRLAVVAAIKTAPPAELTKPEFIQHSMTAFNCYACHARDKVGGPPRDRDPLFLTTIPEMGDEGRVPPPLDGVGDKLNDDWLKQVLENGAKDRPYMLTRMPKFGLANVGHLAEAFIAVDRKMGGEVTKMTESDSRVKATGRQLVGDKALSCIKCHSFGQHRATGIQALNMQTMTQRLRADWFQRYMRNPEAYRPGTRMPASYVNGVATVRTIYEGDAGKQITAMWTFLKDGNQAGIPEGLIANVIELKPEDRPILYRNFIAGLSPRGIAVGYPEKGHLAYDADKLNLALLWHGRFIDAGLHWEGRGPGFQKPLGDHIVPLEETVSIATLDSPNDPWPIQPAKDRGYKFLGYTLDAKGRPHFRYKSDKFEVVDFPEPIAQGAEGSFKRHLTITAQADSKLYFRAASGQSLEAQSDGSYLLNGTIRIRVPAMAGQPIVRDSVGNKELLVPIMLTNGKAEIVQEISW